MYHPFEAKGINKYFGDFQPIIRIDNIRHRTGNLDPEVV